MSLPSLPPGGPLRVLAVSAAVAIVCLLAAAVWPLAKKRWQEAAWAAAPVGLAVVSVLLGGTGLWAHRVLSVLVAGVALRNAVRIPGVVRVASLLGVAGWLVALVAARAMFQ